MTAAITTLPFAPTINTAFTTTATGLGDFKTRFLLDGLVVADVCYPSSGSSATDLTAGPAVTTQTVSVEQRIADTWTEVATLDIDVADAPAPSGPITGGTLIQDQVIQLTMPQPGAWVALETGIGRSGASAGSPLSGLTLRRCTIVGGQWGALLQFVTSFLIEDCLFTDIDRAAIALFSCSSGIIRRNRFLRIGYVRTDFTTNPGLGNNAWAILTNRMESGSLVTDPVSSDIEIYENFLDWIPLWQGINGHGTDGLSIHDNELHHMPRGIFVAGTVSPSHQANDVDITDNLVLDSVTKSGGTTDQTAIKLLSATGSNSVTGNQVGASYTSDDVDTTGSSGGPFTPNPVVAG